MKAIDDVKLGFKDQEVLVTAQITMVENDRDDLYFVMFNILDDPLRLVVAVAGNFVDFLITKGYTAEALKFALMNQGYSRAAIDVAVETANKELSEKAPVLKEKPIIKYELIDENNNPIKIGKISFWEKIVNFFFK